MKVISIPVAAASSKLMPGMRARCSSCRCVSEMSGQEIYYSWHGEKGCDDLVKMHFPETLIFKVDDYSGWECDSNKVYYHFVLCLNCREWMSVSACDSCESAGIYWQYDPNLQDYSQYADSFIRRLKKKFKMIDQDQFEEIVFRNVFEIRLETHKIYEKLFSIERQLNKLGNSIERVDIEKKVNLRAEFLKLEGQLSNFLVVRSKIEELDNRVRRELLSNIDRLVAVRLESEKQLFSVQIEDKSNPQSWDEIIAACEKIINLTSKPLR